MVDLYVPQAGKGPGIPNFDGRLRRGDQEGAVRGEGQGTYAGAVATGVNGVMPF